MKNSKISLLAICCLVFFSTNLTACGQKGPLIVEQPVVVQNDALNAEIDQELSEEMSDSEDDE